MSRVVWQWIRREIQAAVVAAGFDDLNAAHVALFRYPTLDGRRPSDLAEEMQITRQSVNELLGHLERHGYLVRDTDPSDNRSRRIRLTERGRAVEDATFVAAARAERDAAKLVGDDRIEELRRTLTDLISALGLSGETVGAAARS